VPNSSDPIWGVIGLIATIVFGIFGVVGVILAFLQLIQTKKQLSYKLVSITPILEVAKEYQDQIEIRFKRRIFKNVHLVVIQFSNSGRASIKPDDYVRPLNCSIKTGQIISVEVTETKPDNLGELIEAQDATNVVFKNTLLNIRDKFTVKLLIGEFSGKGEDVLIDARIEGVVSLEEIRENMFVQAIVQAIELPTGPLISTVLAATLFPIFLTFLIGTPLISALASSWLTLIDTVLSQVKRKK
jgi:hypothetical protein